VQRIAKEASALEQSFDELNATHDRLVEAHEKLGKAHTKLKKAHSLLLEQEKERVVESCDVGLKCDILDESFYKPIIVVLTNPSCSATTSTSPIVMVSLMMPHLWLRMRP
jgi:hypothetical protein